MTASVSSIDDILIGVFLTASLLFIIIWSIMLLKWRKKYLYKIFPCVPNRTNAARIKKQERLNHRTEIMNINEANNARRFSNNNNNNNNTVNTTINTTSTTNTNTNTAKSSEILTAANTIISTETTLTTPTKQEDTKQPIKPSPSVITIGERSGEVELEHETISYDRDNPFVDTVTEITEKKRKSSEIDSHPVITATSSTRNNNYQLSSHYPLSSSSSSSSSSNSGEFDTTNLKGNGKDANNISSDDNPFEDGRNPFEYLNQREYDDGAELDVDDVKPELQSRF